MSNRSKELFQRIHSGAATCLVSAQPMHDSVQMWVNRRVLDMIIDTAKEGSREVISLTPAQVHADKMLELLREAKTVSFQSWCTFTDKADALIMKIDPQPVTLEEALEALRNIITKPINTDAQPLFNAGRKLLERATLTGVRKWDDDLQCFVDLK
jgi:hypothetical protein